MVLSFCSRPQLCFQVCLSVWFPECSGFMCNCSMIPDSHKLFPTMRHESSLPFSIALHSWPFLEPDLLTSSRFLLDSMMPSIYYLSVRRSPPRNRKAHGIERAKESSEELYSQGQGPQRDHLAKWNGKETLCLIL